MNTHIVFPYYVVGKYAYSDAGMVILLMLYKSVTYSVAAYVGSQRQDCSLGFETEPFLKTSM